MNMTGAQVINLLGSTTSSRSGTFTMDLPDMPFGPAHPWYNFHNQRTAIPPGAPRPNSREGEMTSSLSSWTVHSDYIPSDEERRRARSSHKYHQESHSNNRGQQYHKDSKSKAKPANKRKRYSEDSIATEREEGVEEEEATTHPPGRNPRWDTIPLGYSTSSLCLC